MGFGTWDEFVRLKEEDEGLNRHFVVSVNSVSAEPPNKPHDGYVSNFES